MRFGLPGRRDVIYAVDGFEKDCVGETDFRNPESADHVCPASVVRLFEGAAAIRTKATFDGTRRRLEAPATKPLTL